MVGMSMGVAAAADYPAPFVVGGSANVAIVYGTGAGVDPSDLVQAGNVQSNLQSFMGSSGTSTTVSGSGQWEAGTSSDKLEIGESLKDIDSYIGGGELGLLADGTLSNEKGEAKYEQFMYFEDVDSSAVNYTQDDDENQGLFFTIKSNKVIARYVMDFTNNLKSDIESDNELSDIEDKEITFLGKTYTIVTADNGSSGIELTLMSGALGGTVSNDVPLTVGEYEVGVLVSSASAAEFTITKGGVTDTTSKMAKGDMETLSDGNYLAVTDITYQGFAEGIMNAQFYIGADKMEWKNGSSMTTNTETINEAAVLITHTEASSDVAISEISINMTAEDNLYVPVNGKLGEVPDLDEPEVLVSQNWDIQFEGLEAVDYEDISLKRNTDLKYVLRWENYNGEEIKLPLVQGNTTGVYGGDTSDKRFVLNPNGSLHDAENITDNDYFLLHTADPVSSTSDAKTILIQYKGADKIRATTTPTVTFTVNPGPNQIDKTLTVTKTTGVFTLKYAGGTWNFRNASDGETKDYSIVLTDDDYHSGSGQNLSLSQYIRTGYNTLINITQSNSTVPGQEAATAQGEWLLNITVDDTNRDGDEVILTEQVFSAKILNSTSTDLALTWNASNPGWLTDPDDSTVQTYITRYGASLEMTDPADSPPHIETKVPKSIVRPLVYISTGDVSVSTTSGDAAASLGDVLVKDSEVSTVSTKNLVVVGGSCINSAAATLVGGAKCTGDFTTATGIGAGQFVIKGYASSSLTSEIALLVAGYETADTKNAVTYLRTQTVDTDKEYKGTDQTTATLVTTEVTE